MGRAIRAISLDVGGTLIDPYPSVGHVYAEVAKDFGLIAEPELLTSQFISAWKRKLDFDYSKAHWKNLVDASFVGIGEVEQRCFDAIYNRFVEAGAWQIHEDVPFFLETLRSKNLRTIVISNWDDRLPPLLGNLQLASFFEDITFSTAVGALKPNPKIFQHAASRLALPPQEILHIGDGREEDYLGAQRAGFQSLLLKRGMNPSHPGEIKSLAEILSRLD